MAQSRRFTAAKRLAIDGLFDEDVTLLIASVGARPKRLPYEEMALVRGAAPARQREFSTGRWLARRALHRYGVSGFSLRIGGDGEPIWPAGMTGSITHAAGLCAVAVACLSDVRGVGLDIERATPLEGVLWPRVFTPLEVAWLHTQDMYSIGVMATLLFACKESVAKASFHQAGTWLDFTHILIRVDLDCCTFTPYITDRYAERRVISVEDCRGRFTWDNRRIIAAFTWRHHR